MLVDKNDIKILTTFQILESSISKEQKNKMIDFIDEHSIETSMNLLLTGNLDELSELERRVISRRFEESKLNNFILYLNEQAEEVSDNLITEGWFPSSAEIKAMNLAAKYMMTSVGQAHLKASAGLATLFHQLKGDFWSIGPVDIPKLGTSGKMFQTTGAIMGGSITLAAAAAASAVAYLGYKIYKRFLSKYARQCNSASGKAKTVCMAAAKANAFEARIKAMESKKGMCAKSKEPDKCKAKVDKKINDMKAKLNKMQSAVGSAKSAMMKLSSKAKQKKQGK